MLSETKEAQILVDGKKKEVDQRCKSFFLLRTGLKLLVSIFCFGATFYQSYILYDNYKSKETLWKHSEIYYPDNYTTPMIIVCSDPGNTNSEEPLIKLDKMFNNTGYIPQIRSFKTIYKVLYLCMFKLLLLFTFYS